MLKNKIIAIGFVALFGPFVFWASQSANSQVEQKIRNVENGLIEFKPGSPAENAPAPKKMALSERMAFYKVPGVSIAVIHDHKIEWAKGYGLKEAGGISPVTLRGILIF
jgi:CubicO group peptidase (beta-lactamase class C family)